jgi:hypothetical protein
MSQNVPTAFVVEYRNNMALALQQRRAKIWPFIPLVEAAGERIVLKDFIGSVTAYEKDTRHSDTEYVNTPHDRLHIPAPNPMVVADLVDKEDQLRAKIQLTSGYMMSAVAALNRAKDAAALRAIFGNMITGKDGTTTVPFPSANVVAASVGAGAATRMNVAKLRAARKLLAQNQVDMDEEKFMVLTAEQIDDLMNEVPVTSADFSRNAGKVNDEGRLNSFMGFTFIEMELGNTHLGSAAALTVDGSGYRKNPFWVKSGLVGGEWESLFTDITRLPTKHYSTQVYARWAGAATRTENGKVGYVLNSEAA